MKALIVVGVIVAVLVIVIGSLVSWGVGVYNGVITKDEEANKAWSNVENLYQQRYDMIPNLVEVVKGYATHEKGLLVEVAQARASVGQMKLTKEALSDPKAFAAFQKAQDGLAGVLQRLMVVTENYPTLKANEGFLKLQGTLEGLENGIANGRRNYNLSVNDFNTTIRKFPATLIASSFGFKEKEYFKTSEEAKVAPKVKF